MTVYVESVLRGRAWRLFMWVVLTCVRYWVVFVWVLVCPVVCWIRVIRTCRVGVKVVERAHTVCQ